MRGERNIDGAGSPYERERRDMVDLQIAARGVASKKVLGALLKVRRELFVPEGCRLSVYDDRPLPIGQGQTISQPYMVALMTECLDLRPGDTVLEIGTGCGYQTAILAELAARVYSVERVEALAAASRDRLDALGYTNVRLTAGDGTLGWEEYAPYDKIIVTAGAMKIPDALVSQLAEGGKLVIPVGSSFSQMLVLVTKEKGLIRTQDVCPCVFVHLIGKDGWKE